jgi:hypothetical protein
VATLTLTNETLETNLRTEKNKTATLTNEKAELKIKVKVLESSKVVNNHIISNLLLEKTSVELQNEKNKELMKEIKKQKVELKKTDNLLKLEQKENKQLKQAVSVYASQLSEAHKRIMQLSNSLKLIQSELESERAFNTESRQIAANVRNLVEIIPVHSSIRSSTIRRLGAGLSGVSASRVLGVSPSAVSKARNSRDNGVLLSIIRDPLRFYAPRVDVQLIIQFWLVNCAVPSGSKRTVIDYTIGYRVPVHIQRISTLQLHVQYLAVATNPYVSYPTFKKYKPFNVRKKRLPTKADLIDLCPHCTLWKKLMEKQKLGTPLTTEEKVKFEELLLHRHVSWTQMQNYLNTRQLVENDPEHKKVLIVQDFTKLYVGGVKYNSLMISILVYCPKEQRHIWLYFDFVQKGGGGLQDHAFVRDVWLHILGKRDFKNPIKSKLDTNIQELLKDKQIFVFSDGARQHFKQGKTISFWAYLSKLTGVILDINFYGSYHGHNVCDAHSCHIKLCILRAINARGLENMQIFEEYLEELIQLKNIHILLIEEDEINRSVSPSVFSLYIERYLHNTRHIHRCISEGDSYLCYHLSNDKNPAIVIKHPNDEQLKVHAILCEEVAKEREEKQKKIQVLNEEKEKETEKIKKSMPTLPKMKEKKQKTQEIREAVDKLYTYNPNQLNPFEKLEIAPKKNKKKAAVPVSRHKPVSSASPNIGFEVSKAPAKKIPAKKLAAKKPAARKKGKRKLVETISDSHDSVYDKFSENWDDEDGEFVPATNTNLETLVGDIEHNKEMRKLQQNELIVDQHGLKESSQLYMYLQNSQNLPVYETN